ncbi:MAG: AmmeMemoRadiSam system protein B [Candidatus Eisenbacteria bacterium]
MRRRNVRWTIALALAGLVLLSACSGSETSGKSQKEVGKVRKSAVAGAFYPAERGELRQVVDEFLGRVVLPKTKGDVVGVVVPHAGYVYSGDVAAHSYSLVRGGDFRVVFLVGPSHRMPVSGAAVYTSGTFQTPLGSVEIDEQAAGALVKAGRGFVDDKGAHTPEHSLEVQLPFLQVVLEDFKIVPILTTDLPASECEELGRILAGIARGRKALLVASTDLSHYPAYEDAKRVDGETLESWKTMDLKLAAAKENEVLRRRIRNLSCTMCGGPAVMIVMAACKALGADSITILKYANSGDVSGDKSGVVGYAAAALLNSSGRQRKADVAGEKEEFSLSQAEREKLLSIARGSIDAVLQGKPIPKFDATEPNLKLACGAFVTLHEFGNLRGCIGRLVADKPLHEVVSRMAVAAATEDHRFSPVARDELEKIEIEISVLSPLKKMSSLEELRLGKHGIYVVSGARSGCYLPQVAIETGWSKEEFLRHCCAEKAGLEPDAWKRDADVFLFTAEVFSE